MTYPGYKELKNYLTGNKKLSFIKFVNDNIDMLPMWSIEDNANTGSALFGTWYKRYKQTYGEFNETSKNLKKPQYNYLIWNLIIDKSRRKRLESSYHEGVLGLLIEARRSATEEGRRLLNPGTVAFHSTDYGKIAADENAQVVDEADKGDSSSEATQISTENHETDVSLDLLYPFGAKKILGKLTRDDVQKIKYFEIKESSIVARMKKHVITPLLKNSLTPTETETMKLLLSSDINFVDYGSRSI
ncbi:hypothetical protein G6F46_003720 [Rhizopus delemar]|uniref:Uncharacterized protein n=3 Tax=Rhizopus TaxID=4842 RepID=I1CKR7_RHIO9|nr:hypothetical protein RO3G_13758 [Rhizopus delemar RA 99-880]KAG1463523.1 hypothetical protein G6F55_002339 [Rhizopus delemar]KAG1548068.1 hypothetical protein G6F51_003886 [Rhizopus arrhizus]KAG1501246.1 hypothetical protein G6F54_003166 [Rhizopus delemar]KAG1515249.1 hypothetical protein G6F52_009731 [Rhizopus delemar]|eukprot:EIE89047.1 hypothetical protein RO3G_13758 [Rhizopus delemar RA 99-880]